MKCLVWLLLLIVGIVAEEGAECPDACVCTEEGIGPYIATCSALNANQKFGYKIARLVLKGDGLTLPDGIFQLVALQDVSTIYISNSTFKSIAPRAFDNMQHLTKLIVESSRMQLHPDVFNTTLLTQLTLKQSQINIEYGKYMFKIPTLRELYISECQLSSLPPEPFSEMPLLTHITLSSSKIKQLSNKTFSSLKDLQDVDLSDNLIKELKPDVFDQNSDLSTLILSKNSLFSLKGISIPFLKELDISLCKFSEIDSDSLSGFPSLDRLNMSGNAIHQIDADAFSAFNDLLYIDLSSNALKGTLLPNSIFQHNSKLETLSLAHNPLGELPKDIFSKLTNLYYMDLSHCELTGLEKGLFKDLTSLVRLNLAENYLDQIKPNTLIGPIKHLDLSFNKFHYVELIEFPFNSDIRKLSLMGNSLQTIDASRLVKLKSLKQLDVRSCGLASIWSIQNFEPCYEESCPAVLENLDTLLISKNNIHSISIFQLDLTPNLKYLDMLNNPLVCNNKLNASLNWLMSHEVEPLLSDDEIFLPDQITPNPDAEKIDRPLWDIVKTILCATKHKETILDEPTTPGVKQVTFDCSNMAASECGVQQEAINIDEQNYMWPIIIVSISALAILLSLIVLVGFVLRWTRQRNSYGAAIIRNQLNTPRLKRGHSSIYEQLYEDPNHPTTPVMTSKNGNQTQYNFPEVVTQEKKKGYISYLSKDEGSKPSPECV